MGLRHVNVLTGCEKGKMPRSCSAGSAPRQSQPAAAPDRHRPRRWCCGAVRLQRRPFGRGGVVMRTAPGAGPGVVFVRAHECVCVCVCLCA